MTAVHYDHGMTAACGAPISEAIQYTSNRDEVTCQACRKRATVKQYHGARDWIGTAVSTTAECRITRLMPGFRVELRGALRDAMPVEARVREFDYYTEAVAYVLACRRVKAEAV